MFLFFIFILGICYPLRLLKCLNIGILLTDSFVYFCIHQQVGFPITILRNLNSIGWLKFSENNRQAYFGSPYASRKLSIKRCQYSPNRPSHSFSALQLWIFEYRVHRIHLPPSISKQTKPNDTHISRDGFLPPSPLLHLPRICTSL